jgi:hypothetical protein
MFNVASPSEITMQEIKSTVLSIEIVKISGLTKSLS